jgi:hypothetical protein
LVTEKKIFKNQPIRKKELPVAAMFVNGSGRNQHHDSNIFFSIFSFLCSVLLIIVCPFILLAHLAKGNVSFCHHLASVVR